MALMRRLLVLFALAGCLTGSASAEYVRYSEYRQDNPLVNDAVALLSSSDIHGTLNRISALNLRSAIRDLPADSDPAELPANYVDGMIAAIDALDEDLVAADADFDALLCSNAPDDPGCLSEDEARFQKWVLLQTINQTLILRVTELNRAGEMLACACIDCVPGDTTWTCAPSEGFSAPLMVRLQELFAGNTLSSWWFEIVDAAEAGGLASWCGSTSTCEISTNANNLGSRLDELRGVHGEPIIDNAHVHGEPIID